MAFGNPFSSFAFGEIFDTVLPDFVLAFAFFTAVTYVDAYKGSQANL